MWYTISYCLDSLIPPCARMDTCNTSLKPGSSPHVCIATGISHTLDNQTEGLCMPYSCPVYCPVSYFCHSGLSSEHPAFRILPQSGKSLSFVPQCPDLQELWDIVSHHPLTVLYSITFGMSSLIKCSMYLDNVIYQSVFYAHKCTQSLATPLY